MTGFGKGLLMIVSAAAAGACIEPVDQAGPHVLWHAAGVAVTQPLVFDSLVIVGFENGRVTAFVRETGQVRWTRQFQGPFLGEGFALVGERLIVPEFSLHAVNVRTGAPLWSYEGIDGRTGIGMERKGDSGPSICRSSSDRLRERGGNGLDEARIPLDYFRRPRAQRQRLVGRRLVTVLDALTRAAVVPLLLPD
jgi:hypothetical protein